MAGLLDPLSILKDFHINLKPIKEQNNTIIFGEHYWPKDAETNYLKFRKQGSNKADDSTKEYYTLECLLFFLNNLNDVHPVYCNKAQAANIPAVYRPDRKALLAYLTGVSPNSASIDKTAPIPAKALVNSKLESNIEHHGKDDQVVMKVEKREFKPEADLDVKGDDLKKDFQVKRKFESDVGHQSKRKRTKKTRKQKKEHKLQS